MITLFTAAFALLASGIVYAEEGSVNSDFEVLKSLYERAEQPAALDDFDDSPVHTTLRCAGALAHNGLHTFLPLKKLTWTVESGIDYGPLFPAKPKKEKTVLAWIAPSERYPVQTSAQILELSFTDSDLINATPLSLPPPYGHIDTLPEVTLLRKSGDLILFRHETGIGRASHLLYYGYCWRQK